MKRIEFKEEVLSNLPLPQAGYKTLGVSDSGELSTIDSTGTIEAVGGTGGGGSSVMMQTKVSVSNVELLDINNTPKTIIAAQGADKYIIAHNSQIRINTNTTPESTNPTMDLVLDWISIGNEDIFYQTAESAWGDAAELAGTSDYGIDYTLSHVNQPLEFTAPFNFTEFDGTIDVYVTYEVRTL